MTTLYNVMLKDDLIDKIANKKAVIGIVGLGYVGLPLAISYAHKGFMVFGIDTNKDRINKLNNGISYITDVINEDISQVISNASFVPTHKQLWLDRCDVISICVPTPLNKNKDPDLQYVEYEAKQLAKYCHEGQLVVLESTVYPGTTRDIIAEAVKDKGCFVAYSPERADPGNKMYGLKNTPKLVGGINKESAEVAKVFYQQIAKDVVIVSSPEIAEMAKVFENVFRNVNIALVNELAMLCSRMGISVWEVIEATATKPFGYMPFYPGAGVGGHCIPLDPYYLAYKARGYDFHTRFIELAAEINESMPYYVVEKISDALNDNYKTVNCSSIMLLGISYKKDIGDIRESPALNVLEMLDDKGASVYYNDDYINKLDIITNNKHFIGELSIPIERITGMDCVVIMTPHSYYDFQEIVNNTNIIYDTCGATKYIKEHKAKIYRLGG